MARALYPHLARHGHTHTPAQQADAHRKGYRAALLGAEAAAAAKTATAAAAAVERHATLCAGHALC